MGSNSTSIHAFLGPDLNEPDVLTVAIDSDNVDSNQFRYVTIGIGVGRAAMAMPQLADTSVSLYLHGAPEALIEQAVDPLIEALTDLRAQLLKAAAGKGR